MPETRDQTKDGSKDQTNGKTGSHVRSDDASTPERSYYYDDAHGYKDFDPDDEKEELDEDDED